MTRRTPLAAALVVALVVALVAVVLATTAGVAGSAATPVAHPVTVTGPAPAAYEASYRTAVAALPVAREVRRGYDRDAFTHWIGQGDGCDTRDRVLIAEAVRRPRVGPGCDLDGGRWRSAYDGETFADSSDLDVDHVVALAEAWDSGARRWSAGTRERFANDLRDRRTLIAVSASSNRSKGDQDPAEWLPDQRRCAYLVHWVAVKVRWRLSVDPAERRFLLGRARTCGNPTVRVDRARVE